MNKIEMRCEYNNCRSIVGKDYVRPEEMKDGDSWDDEPVFLCDLHADEMKVLFKPENKIDEKDKNKGGNSVQSS